MTSDFKRDALIKVCVPFFTPPRFVIISYRQTLPKAKAIWKSESIPVEVTLSELVCWHSGGPEAFYKSSAGASHYLPHYSSFIMLYMPPFIIGLKWL